MDIKPETAKKVAYPVAGAVVAATVLASCKQQQMVAGEVPQNPVPIVVLKK